MFDEGEALYIAIIHQAFLDLRSNSKKPHDKTAREEAILWLLSSHRDFYFVCNSAGLLPEFVRKQALDDLKNPTIWRHPTGQAPNHTYRKEIYQRNKKQGKLNK